MRRRLLLLSLSLLLLLSGVSGAKKKKKSKSHSKRSAERPFTQQQTQQPQFTTVKEEDIPPGTPVKRIREGEVLDLSENARKESERKFAPEVEHMFDAVMSDDFGSLNKVLMEEKVPVDIRGPGGDAERARRRGCQG